RVPSSWPASYWPGRSLQRGNGPYRIRLTRADRWRGGAYLAVQSAIVLLTRFHPWTSLLGLIWLALTVVAMLLLAWGKRMTGRDLGNLVLRKESKVTVVDGILAGAVLLGIGLNALAGLWWADPLAALVIVYYGLREGIAAIRG
ncbi:MAG: cation transporter, partial [Dehalococcoidia bacterium]